MNRAFLNRAAQTTQNKGGKQMKKIISLTFFMLFLVGCSITNDNDSHTTEDLAETSIKEVSAPGFPLTTNEAQEMAEHLVNEMHYSLSQIVQYEGEDPSDELKLKRLYAAKDYVTESFFTTYLSPEFYLCFDEHCPEVQDLPLPIYLGLRYEIEPLNATAYTFSTMFPKFSDDQINSIRQTLTIVFENDSWKIDSFSNKDEDLNLLSSELEEFLNIQMSGPIVDVAYVGTRQMNGVEEEIYQFKDAYTERPFEVIMRTGQINYIGEELDLNEFFADDNNYVDSSDEDFSYSLLFDDYTIYLNEIPSSSQKIQNFLARDAELDGYWAPPYSEDDRDLLNKLHASYNELLTDVYDYYSPFYPSVDGVSELEHFFKSWNYMRSQYFEQAGVDMYALDHYDIHYLMEDTYMIRQQIYKVLLNFSE